jgi:hypothetical protein
LQEQYGYRSPVSYIKKMMRLKKKTTLGSRTVQRALKRLRTRQ